MDTNDKLWDETISIGMSAKGWMALHGLLGVVLRFGRPPSKISGIGKSLQRTIEDVLRRKDLLNAGDIRRMNEGK